MIKFTKIENVDIFTRDFRPLVKNNTISFPTNSEEIAVIYGPNGTGKTSLIKVLSYAKGTKLEFEYDGTSYASGQGIFYIINDQNNRNIIAGETKDFFLGENIKREFEMQNFIASERYRVITALITTLKNTHGISAASSPLIGLVDETEVVGFIKDIANNKSKGKNYTNENLIAVFRSVGAISLPKYDEKKLQFLKNDLTNSNSIIGQIEKSQTMHYLPIHTFVILRKILKQSIFSPASKRVSASFVILTVLIGNYYLQKKLQTVHPPMMQWIMM